MLGGNSDKSELPLQVHLALFISPLFLLIPKSLHKLKGRTDMFEVMEVHSYTSIYI
jgi:hypothetical protein